MNDDAKVRVVITLVEKRKTDQGILKKGALFYV